jgi:hypothetical protein
VPALGTAAAIGLVLYFICAVTAHLRVRDRQIGGVRRPGFDGDRVSWFP